MFSSNILRSSECGVSPKKHFACFYIELKARAFYSKFIVDATCGNSLGEVVEWTPTNDLYIALNDGEKIHS